VSGGKLALGELGTVPGIVIDVAAVWGAGALAGLPAWEEGADRVRFLMPPESPRKVGVSLELTDIAAKCALRRGHMTRQMQSRYATAGDGVHCQIRKISGATNHFLHI
jgi:hypothetical protein